MTTRLALLSLAALAATAASAQISTDRPGLAYSASTVGARVFQIEAGTPQATLTGTADAYQIPVALRYGLTPTIEARISTSVFDVLNGGMDTDSDIGFQTVTVGAKVAVPVSGFSLALIPEALVPARADGDVAFQLNAPASFAAGDFGVTLVPGLAVGNGSTTLNAVGLVSRAFGTLSAYAEVGAFPNLRSGGATPVLAGGGVAALLNADTQVDAFFDAGLNDAAPDLVVGIGISFRLD